MAQVGRITGPLLKDNLERNGINLAFRNTFSDTELLYLDVNTGRIGVNTDIATRTLEVSGTTKLNNLLIPNTLTAGDIEFSGNTISSLSGTINLNASEAVIIPNLENGTIRISDNTISTIESNANIDLKPNGLGTTEIVSNLDIFGNLHASENLTFEGSIVLGNNLNQDTVEFNAVVDTDIIPSQTNTYSLGSFDTRWDALYTNFVNGTSVSVDELQAGLINFNLRHAGKLYVSIQGSDTNVGDHPLGALQTISEALSRAAASGDQPFLIYVSPGEYQEALPLVLPPNVSIIGQDIRNVVIMPDTSSQSEDVFHLDDSCTISNLTIKDFYYDSINNTGYAFRFKPNAIMSNRSPYIQNITVLTNETSNGAGDAGRGAWIDGDELNASTVEKTMLFHSCTFISPGADVINMTNDVRVEWLNSFTYYANRGLYAFAGSSGGAELRSIGSANVYGTYGAVADGANTLMYLIQHNFAYIGAGSSSDNNVEDVVQANEVVELNSGQIHFVSTDQIGNFRVGDNFFVNLETGDTSITINTGDIESLSGLIINTAGSTTVISGSEITTGNLLLTENSISTATEDLNLAGATGTININDNTTIRGNLNIRDDFSFGGTLNIAGDQPGRVTANDRLVFNVEFEQNFKPHVTLTHNLGEAERYWYNAYLDRSEIGNVDIDENYISTDVSNADLELRANGTGLIYLDTNDLYVNNNLTVSSSTSLQNLNITNNVVHTGNINYLGNLSVTNLNVSQDLDVGSQAQFEEILFDGNIITTTTSNTNLELRASGTGTISLFDNVLINNTLTVNDVSVNQILINRQVEFNNADINSVTIEQNYISTNASNTDLELRANGTGLIAIRENDVTIDNGLTVNGTTTLQNESTNYEYGPELVVNGTFDTNLNGWAQVGGGSATAVGGNLRINATGAARNVSQEITVEAGKTYDFEAQFRSVSNSNPFYLRIFESGVGTLFEWNETSGLVPDQLLTASFVPVSTAIDIIFRAVNTIVEWDNVSMFEDIGFVTTFTPVQFNINGDTNHTGNKSLTGNYVQTGNIEINGGLTVSNQFVKSNILIDENVLQNTGEGLRISSNITDPLTLPRIVNSIVNGATADDYPNQQDKNLVNFLLTNDYVDVNNSGTLTTSDYLAYLEYIGNGTTNNSELDLFLQSVIDEIIQLEYATPGYFNSIVFDGDYFQPDLSLQANGSGTVNFPTNNVIVSKNLSASTINANIINVTRDLDLNEIVITDNIVEIDDNFITTTISNANLELKAQENKLVLIPSANVNLKEDLTVNGFSDIKELFVQGNLSQSGNTTHVGNMTINGIVTVNSLNAQTNLQFDDILFENSIITTLASNSNLELQASGTGKIEIPLHNTQIDNNLTLGSLNSSDINVTLSIASEELILSSNIILYDNVISTTESNSDLELRTINNNNIKLKNVIFNNDTISSTTNEINLNSNNLIVNSDKSILLPKGTTVQRQKVDSGIRFNTEDNLFEGFKNNRTITFNGVYSDNRLTSLTAHPSNDVIDFKILSANVGFVDTNGLTIHGLDVDDIFIDQNIIRTNVSNSNLELKPNGTGKLVIDDILLQDSTIENTSDTALTISHVLYGKAKFTSHSLAIPSGTVAERPVSPELGTTRWNTDDSILEVWDGSTFVVASGSAAAITEEEMNDLVLEYTLIFG